MTREELLKILTDCRVDDDPEVAHVDADGALIDYINDEEIAEAYSKINKWYA
ncbi:hypothetical protein LCGC14_1341440 [marine sediment metagenome]|uniref:Uncharacterized protein n=1 Tax=marine sediment metagenome TaxID=412755 RepID=A0A0F9KEE5_9ZZZZ